jgi:thiol-disulfide isomerase/thioredoxin
MNARLLAAAAVMVVVAGTGLAQVNAPPAAPVPAAGQPLPTRAPQPKIYDEAADAKVQIAEAVAKAAKNNRRVLVQWGANWCGWCRQLHELFATDGDIKKKLMYEYDVVLIDVGHFDKNMDLAAGYGADLKKNGLPFLTVLDGTGKAIANQETGALENKGEGAKGHDKAKVMAFLTEHQAEYPAAADVLAAGMAQATKEHKQVFLHFGAPWCGWCHRLEDWMARPEVAAILAKDFVDVKIDQDRTKEAEAVFKKYCSAPGGIPWFCVLEGDKAVCTSDGTKGNIGFPAKPEEIDHFIGMMTKARRNMTAADVAALRASLEKANKKGEEQH